MKVIHFIKDKFSFLASFGFSKLAVYIAPLWLADVLSKEDYGVIEYALSGLGMLVAAGFSLGISNAYPYYILKKKQLEMKDAFTIHPLWLLFLFFLNIVFYFVLNLYHINIFLALNFSYLITNQQFYSTKLKSHESIIKAVIIDSGVYFVLLLFISCVQIGIVSPNIESISVFIFGYSFIYIIYSLFEFNKANKESIFQKHFKILKFSIHFLFGSILIFGITVAGRILAEYFFDMNTVGIYGFYYRLAAIVVILYQVIVIMYFKNIYTYNPKKLDTYFALFYIAIYLISITIFFISPYIVPYFSTYYSDTFLNYKLLYFILSTQMVMWIATALNSSIVDRENVVKKNNFRLIFLIIFGLLLLFYLKESLSLEILTFIHFTIFYLSAMIQYYSLYKKKIIFNKSIITLTILYIISSIVVILNLN